MKKEIGTSLVFVAVLAFIWLFYNQSLWDDGLFFLFDVPVFILLYGVLFMVGVPIISQGIRYGTKASITRTLALPFLLVVIYYLYTGVHGQLKMEGSTLLLPYLLFFPILALYHRPKPYEQVSGWEIIVLILFLFPLTLIEFSGKSNLPLEGYHFDSVYRIIVMIIAVYAFVVVRRLRNVGFWLDLSFKKLWTTVWVWLIYLGIILLLGYFMDFFQSGDERTMTPEYFKKVVYRFLTIFLHTALFEELFFRGLLQNLLAKKIKQSANSLYYWMGGAISLWILALITGVIMDDGLIWFPLVMTFLIFMIAYVLAHFFSANQHHYLAMAITSVLFGLVHYHSGSVVFVGFAILAGWAYGYVYWKTSNVLYAALIHTLVNISPLLLGLELMK